MPSKPRIALCLEYPLALRGGVSVLVENLLAGLQAEYELILVSPDAPDVMAKHPSAALLAGHIQWVSSQVSRASSKKLAEQLAAAQVKLAHFHIGGVYGWGNRIPGQSPVAFLPAHGIKACSTVHLVVSLLDGYCGPQKPLWFKLAMLPLAWGGKLSMLRQLSREIAVSEHDAAKLRRWYWPQSGKFTQLYHSRLRRGHGRRDTQSTIAREPIILNVGHVAWRKGQIFLATAFATIAAKYPEWKLWIAGDLTETNAVEEIQEIARTNNLSERIVLLGERADAMPLMQRTGIYVQPSYFEALGLALQEAQFLGAASIGTRVGGIPELIAHGRTGVLVEPGNVPELAAALEQLISQPALRAQYGQAAAEDIVARGMTVEQMTARHSALYREILGGGGHE